MNFISNVLDRTGKAFLDQCFRIVADPDSVLHAPLSFAINAISTAGSAHQADSSQEALSELELTPETHLFGRLFCLSQVQHILLEERLDRAYSIYEKIHQDQIPQEIGGLAKTLENLETIEKFLIARDKLVVWREVAAQSGLHEGRPEFAELNSLNDYLTKAAEFGDWLEGQSQALGITELRIVGKDLSSIPPEIGKLTQLQKLFLNGNQIQKIEGLEPLQQLQELWFNGNQIQKIEGLENLTQLEDLFLSGNEIQKIEGLENLAQLQELHLNGNQIQRIEGLEMLTQLQKLKLSMNQIQKIEGLESLTQLQELHLNGNQIQKIEGIETLTQLQMLDLNYNQIHKLERLENLTQLRRLGLRDNKIQKLEGLENLTQLKWLNLGHNQIQRIEGVEHLPHLRLVLFENPVNSRFGCNLL